MIQGAAGHTFLAEVKNADGEAGLAGSGGQAMFKKR